MRSVAAAVVLVTFMLLCPTSAAAQDTDVPPAVPSPAVVEEEGDPDARPWGRLLVFVPLSALIGAAAVVGRRAARERGWTQS